MTQCAARMASGRQCGNRTAVGSDLCVMHQHTRWNPHTRQSEPVTHPVVAWHVNRCAAVRKTGARCQRPAPMGETLCAMHRAKAE